MVSWTAVSTNEIVSIRQVLVLFIIVQVHLAKHAPRPHTMSTLFVQGHNNIILRITACACRDVTPQSKLPPSAVATGRLLASTPSAAASGMSYDCTHATFQSVVRKTKTQFQQMTMSLSRQSLTTKFRLCLDNDIVICLNCRRFEKMSERSLGALGRGGAPAQSGQFSSPGPQ